MRSITGLLICMLFAANLLAEPPLVFPPSPRLATTPTELVKFKETREFPAHRDAVVRAAMGRLKNPVALPKGWGNWVFYYACPDDGTSLEALNLKEHRCPRCRKVHTDERTVAAYRTLLHGQANLAALDLAWAFAYTGDDRFAREVQRLLVGYADEYPNYPQRRDRWGREGILAPLGGRRYSQSLDEAVGIIKLAKAYDLTRSSAVWTDAQRQHVEKDLFRLTADTLLWSNRDINNHQTWYNAGLMAIASVLGDQDLVRKILTMRGGFHDQLKRSIGREGLWYEGTMAYHNYALQAMIEIVDAGRRLGLPLHLEPGFRRMIEVPLQCGYPNGVFPALNDSDPAHVSSFAHAFLWAWQVYGEPRFAQAWAHGNPQQLARLLGPEARPQPFLESRSLNLPDAGLAILRRGEGAAAACVMLDYGPHGGAHGHYDKLSLVLFAQGREWLLDPGRLTYSHKEYQTWVKHTAAHNTVTLGGRSQAEAAGQLLWFDVQDAYAACAAQTDRAYPNARLRRYLLLTSDYLVDLFEVESKKETQIDWLIHAASQQLRPATELGPGAPAQPGTQDGYPHLTQATSWRVKGPSRWEFQSGGKPLRVWLAGPSAEEIIACTGIGYSIDARVPCMIRRVQAAQARFVAVCDLSDNGQGVRAVQVSDQEIVVTGSSGRLAIRFQPTRVTVRNP